ncbi:MAG: hypothetical protein LAO19_15695 [Acidobacteriia bacterium]|nr:hypothetical protein [Terriglobia bacterium]
MADALATRRRNRPKRVFKINPYGEGGVFPGVNLDDSAALEDIMDPPEEIRKKFMS